MIPITQRLLPVPSLRRSGQKILGVRFLVAHDTGNDSSTAAQNVNYYIGSANQIQASAHYFVDDKEIICCVPETEKAWQVRYDVPKDNQLYGKDANDWAIGVELCFHSQNTKVNSQVAYKNYVDLFAYLCKKYNLNPLKDIVGHYTLDPARRSDPINAFKYSRKSWDDFLNDVKSAMGVPAGDTVAPTQTSVCKVIKDANSRSVGIWTPAKNPEDLKRLAAEAGIVTPLNPDGGIDWQKFIQGTMNLL